MQKIILFFIKIFSEMFSKIQFVLIIIGMLSNIETAFIEVDSAKDPFIFKLDKEIEYEASHTEFTYLINVTVVNDIKHQYEMIQQLCIASVHFRPFFDALFKNLSWHDTLDKESSFKNIIHWQPTSLQQLELNVQKLKIENNTSLVCTHLPSITEELIILNEAFNNLKASNFIPISQIIPPKVLIGHAYTHINKTNFTCPLDFTHWFVNNFYKYAKIDFQVKVAEVSIKIKIPLYAHATLSKIYVKPIIHNNVPYVYNTNTQYLVDSHLGQKYFSNFAQSCFYAKNKTFCNKPQYKNDCDDKFIVKSTSKFDEKCFDKRQFRNIITEISNDLYILVIDPLSIDINCSGSLQTIQLFQSAKIINNDCSISTAFYKPKKNSARNYGVYFSKPTKSSKNSVENVILIQFYCFLAFLLLYVLFINIILYYYYKKRSFGSSFNSMESAV